jgi:oxygen-independent coproporphyrinogen-3 oxidase
MSGLYLHIPFCRQACHYCDFHFSTVRKTLPDLMEAMRQELRMRADELPGRQLETVYFGGGTPSILPFEELEATLRLVRELFDLSPEAEITLEANPDDLESRSLEQWRESGINRLSVGIQSFHEADLRYMNRVHTAQEALSAVRRAREAGFDLLTIDLIYGTPGMDDERWQDNLETLRSLALDHFSAYSLTVEPRTALDRLIRQRVLRGIDEDQAARQFGMLLDWAEANGFEHYEISNFARPGRYARHNTAYWFGMPYLGIGPSAHSFDGRVRSAAIRNNPEYIRSIQSGRLPLEREELSPASAFNEYILTRLRTQWGVLLEDVRVRFGETVWNELRSALAEPHSQGLIELVSGGFRLTRQGKYFADAVAGMLFRSGS